MAIDGFPMRIGQITVWQGDGVEANVIGTVYGERVPHGVDLQWLGIRSKRIEDSKPEGDYHRCTCPRHLETHDSEWMHRTEFYSRHNRPTGKQVRSWCKECERAEVKWRELKRRDNNPRAIA